MKILICTFYAALVTSVVVAQPVDIRQALVAYWQMDSTDGTITPDATSFSNHMYLANMTAGNFVAGRFGNAAMFVANATTTASYLTNLHAPENVTGLPIYRAGSYTVTMWVNGGPQTARYLYTEANVTGNNAPLFILQTGQAAANNSKFDVIIRNDANSALVNHVVSSNVVFDNTWHHIAWVDDRGNARVYIDGNLDPANFSYSPAGTFTMQSSTIGTLVRAAISTNVFNGLIDDVAVWERPLGQDEVRQVMTNSLQAPVPVLPPYILAQPTNTLHLGDRLTLRAVGTRPLSYQWVKGSDIPDAIGSTLTLSNLTTSDSGDYTVRVTNPDGPLVSSVATITVLPDPPVDVREGLVSFWPFEEIVFDDMQTQSSTVDLYSRNDIQLFPFPFLDQASGPFGFALQFNGTDQYGVRSSGFPIYNNPAYSVAFWVNGLPQNDRRIFAEDSTNSTTPLFGIGTHNTGLNGSLRVFIRGDNNVVLRDRLSTGTALDGTWHHVVWTDNNGEAKLYIDGVLDETEFTYTRRPLTANRTAVGALIRNPLTGQLAGALDELGAWNRVLTYTEIQEIRANSVPPPIAAIAPSITQHPASQSAFTRGTVSFSVLAAGTAPLRAQWRREGTNISGATNFSLVLSNLILTDAGDYDVVITNSAGSVTSLVATLSVALRPDPPAELKIDFNETGQESPALTQPGFASFALEATGPGPFRRIYGGAEVVLTGIGVSLQSRLRETPVNSQTFTESQIFRDFVFASDTAIDQGMDIAVQFLQSNKVYDVTIWSFDDISANNRISDWFANLNPVQTRYTFDGNAPPTSDGQYRFSFSAQSDSEGTILIQGRRSSLATQNFNVFINALQVTRRDLRITAIQLIAADTLRLTLKLRDPNIGHGLEQKTSINDANWMEVTDAVFSVPNGDVQEVTVPLPGGAMRFYRVIELP